MQFRLGIFTELRYFVNMQGRYKAIADLTEMISKMESLRDETIVPARQLKYELCIEDAEELRTLLVGYNEDQDETDYDGWELNKYSIQMKMMFLKMKVAIYTSPKIKNIGMLLF